MKNIFIGILMTVLLCGCANMSTVSNDSGAVGTSKIFKYPYDDVAAAALESAQSLNVTIKKTEKNGDTYQILFSKAISAWSWGEVGSINVKPLDAFATVVSVESQKRDKFQITGTDEKAFSEAIFSGIESRLNKK